MAEKELFEALMESDPASVVDEPVAEPTPEPVPEQQPAEPIAEQADEQVAETPSDLSQDPRFREFQSSYDKKITEKDRRIAELEAKVQEQTPPESQGPAPELTQQQQIDESIDQLMRDYAQAEEAGDEEQLRAMSVEYGRLLGEMQRIDPIVAARNAGIEPQQLYEALEQEAAHSRADLERMAWRIAAQQSPNAQLSGQLEEQRKQLQQERDAFEKEKQDFKVQLTAEIRQELGMNNVAGVSPAGTPTGPEARIRQQLAALEGQYGTNAMQRRLDLQDELAQLEA